MNPFSGNIVRKYFLTFRLPFILWMVSFTLGKLFSWMESHLFCFCFSCLGGQIQKIFLGLMSESVLPVFSSSSFMASGFALKCLIHCEVAFEDGMRKDSSVILVHVCSVFPSLLTEETPFSSLCSLTSFGIDELTISLHFTSVAQSCLTLCDPMNHSTPGLPVHQQLSWSPPKPMSIESVMHPTISSSVVPFSSCPQSFPASGSFQMSQLSLSIYMLISGLSILSHGSMCIYFVLIPYHLEYYYYCSIFWNQGWLPWWLRWWRICLKCRRPGFNPWVGEIPWRRKWQPTPVFLLLDHAEWKWWEWSRLVRAQLALFPVLPPYLSEASRRDRTSPRLHMAQGVNWTIVFLLPSPGHSFVNCVPSLTQCPFRAFLILMGLC